MRVTACIAMLLCACGQKFNDTSSDPGVDSGTSSTDPGGGGGGGGSDSGSGGATTPGTGPYFTTPMFWNRDVSNAPKAATSDATIAALHAGGGFGGGRIQIDFSIDVLAANAATPMRSFTTTGDFYSPDCDHVQVPVPPNGNLEGETGYSCTTDGDCHLLVYDPAVGKLFEMWRANITSTFYGGCLAVWNLGGPYTDTLRGDQCTSADAAGYPISPLLFTADEVAAGHIDHAIRFILPNNRVREGFVRPATHGTSTTGSGNEPYYGVHLRLRANYPVDSLPPGARVVARAMQKYGMYHADGGTIALTAQSDRYTTAKWAGLLGAQDLAALTIDDFEVIDHGAPITLTGDCNR